MSKGAMPVPYIIAIVIGIIVIGVLAYMFVTKTGIFSGFTSEQECKAKLKVWCTQWQLSGFDPLWPHDNPFASGQDNDFAPECRSFSWARNPSRDDCEKELGLK
ncbi:hypothetical protein DRP04_16100 [Archaeoglobales archaeon]|nr:MAG: hypothetical protein DRP04_16100 [Archaeoglobales archaeon]